MIDFHTHILPGIDDGFSDLSQSIEALEGMKKSGVNVVLATPHYYRDREPIERFIEKRNKAYKLLIEECEKRSAEIPEIVLGAEVEFFAGMSKNEDISKLCIENTNYLLLEMPFAKWDSFVITEVMCLSVCQAIIPIIAHAERYVYFKNKISKLCELQIPIQINASTIIDIKTARKYLKLIKKGKVHLLGSDCHNLNDRKPNLAEAYQNIEKNIGLEYVEKINSLGSKILNNKF